MVLLLSQASFRGRRHRPRRTAFITDLALIALASRDFNREGNARAVNNQVEVAARPAAAAAKSVICLFFGVAFNLRHWPLIGWP